MGNSMHMLIRLLAVMLPFSSCSQPPSAPTNAQPANNSTLLSTNANLAVSVSDPQNDALNVAFYARVCPPASGPDFTIIGLPDTQYYTGELNGGSNAIFKSQMNWIVANRVSENIVLVEGLGDCVQNGDNVPNEWKRADTSYKIIENPATTMLTHGIPYGINVGNHDQTPTGSAAGTTNLFNQYFGVSRFTGRPYYGGNFGTNNNNNYVLFSASGLDFIVINLEYNPSMSAPLIAWVQNLLTTYSDRRAIIGSHYIIAPAGTWGIQGEALYNAVKNYPNVFLMLCGHVPEEGSRKDTLNGNVITTLLSDYQDRNDGGDGWMRIMKFSPANNSISVKTYSPWLNQYETDLNSQFSFYYHMQETQFENVGNINSVVSGNTATLPYNHLLPNTCYEWYAKVSDGTTTVTSPTWTFTTGDTAKTVTMQVKALIEGYYKESGTMRSPFNNAVADSISIRLHYPNPPYEIAASKKTTLSTTGIANCTFPDTIYGNEYYVSLSHRNAVQTWSHDPISIGENVIADFTNFASSAFGNNLRALDDGKFALYSGDVDQSGFVNLFDYLIIQIYSHSYFTGYHPNDLTGDNMIETVDFSIVENNMNSLIRVQKP